MPTYEYRCDACGFDFERFQSITAAPIRKCPQCGKNKVRRLISVGGGMIFKGSGFYSTDYRDAGYKEKAKADSAAAGASGDTKTQSKSDAKTESTASKTEAAPAAVPKPEPKASKSAAKK